MGTVKEVFITVLLLCSVTPTWAHHNCPDLATSHEQFTSNELKNIATACKSESIKQLFYNRAYHKELISESRYLFRLIPHSEQNSNHRLYAYHIYISMIEAMAPIWYPDAEARAQFLNNEYELQNEIAELRINGYDQLADRLEHSI